MAQPREPTTLGWFVGTELLKEKRKNGKAQRAGGAGAGVEGAQTTKRAASGGQKSSDIDSKSSSEPSSSTNSSSTPPITENSNSPQKIQHSSYAGAARSNCIPGGSSTVSIIPLTMKESTVPPSLTTVIKKVEDYWFYDYKTDGYYYNKDGKTGWTKRQHDDPGPMGRELEVARRKHLKQVPLTPPRKQYIPQNLQNSQAQWKPRSLLNTPNPQNLLQWKPQNLQNSQKKLQETGRYDPTSDGYFYDQGMRWVKRQPGQIPPPPPGYSEYSCGSDEQCSSEYSEEYRMSPTPPPSTPRSPAEYIWAFTDLFSSAPSPNNSIFDSEWLESLKMEQPPLKSDVELLNAIMADLKMGEKKLPNYINRNSILIQMEKIEFIPQHRMEIQGGSPVRRRGRKSRSIRPINRFKRVFMRLQKSNNSLETIEENLELEKANQA